MTLTVDRGPGGEAAGVGRVLGSTFDFVFETQMENLQNGDRFYYLSRLEGTNFLNQLEGTTFSELVMRNTDTTHLPLRRLRGAHSTRSKPATPSTHPVDAARKSIGDDSTMEKEGLGVS